MSETDLRSLPLIVDQEKYETGSLSFRTALATIIEGDTSHLGRIDWTNSRDAQILSTWLEDVKKITPTTSVKANIAKIIGGVGLMIDFTSVATAYSIQMGNEKVLNFFHRIDTLLQSHGGESFLKFIDVVAKSPQLVNTFPMIDSPTANGLLAFASYPDVLVNKGGAVVAALGIPVAIEELIRRKKNRIKNGEEFIHKREKVGTVLIGPISLTDVIAEKSKALKMKKYKDISVHTESGKPSNMKIVERHFQITSEHLISFAKHTSEHKHKWGLTKAKRLVLAAFDENFSLFYGPDATHGLRASNMTTILAALAPEQSREGLLAGKRTLVMVPYGTHMVGASTTQRETLEATRQTPYLKKLRESGMEVKVTTPEEILYDGQLKGLIQKAKEAGNNTVLLVGNDGEVETSMLNNFRSYLLKQDSSLTNI